MFAVAGRKMADSMAAALPAGAWLGALALPRRARRFARFAEALIGGRVDIPPRIGWWTSGAFMAATLAYGVALGGHAGAVAGAASGALGFEIAAVDVAGNEETSEIDVLQALGLDVGTSLVTLDATAAREAVRALPWVADATIRKVYPDRLSVTLKERHAFAIWQHGSELSLIERSGSVIAPFDEGRFAGLPLYVGLGAEQQAAGFDRAMAAWPGIKAQVKAFVRVADRRWDLRLENGVTVRLPETGTDAALARLAAIDAERGLLARDILAVDLRFDDRVIVRLTPQAAEERREEIDKRNAAFKAAEKRA